MLRMTGQLVARGRVRVCEMRVMEIKIDNEPNCEVQFVECYNQFLRKEKQRASVFQEWQDFRLQNVFWVETFP